MEQDSIQNNALLLYLSNYSSYILNCFLLMLFVFIVCLIFVVRVPPARRLIVVHLGGSVNFLSEGLYFYLPTWYIYGKGPFSGITGDCFDDNSIPAPGSRIVIDPKPTQIQTADGVTCTVDVQIECVVLNYDASVLQLNTTIPNLCSTRVNVWVSQCLGKVCADDLVYSNVIRLLNTKGALEELNESLSGICVRVDRVSVDARGISLSRTYQTQRDDILAKMQSLDAREKQLQREMEIMQIENLNKLHMQQAEIERKKALVNAETDLVTYGIQILESQHKEQETYAERLLKLGFTPSTAASILNTDMTTRALKDTPNVAKILSLPSNFSNSPLYENV